MSAVERPPFDALDAATAEAYVRKRELAIIDPFTRTDPPDDLIFRNSLSGARFILAERFGIKRGDGLPFRAYPFIVGRPSANAFATEDAGLQLCGLDVGLATSAFEISLFVFSQSSLFKEIGLADDERSPCLPEGAQLAFWTADRLRQSSAAVRSPVGLELIPKAPQRQLAAQFLTQLQLRFVWLHELYHCLNGHTGLLASTRPGAVLNEMYDEDEIGMVELESDENSKKRKLLRHAMEYDADRSALWMLVRMQQIDLEPMLDLAVWPKSLRLKISIFAAVMMTFVFDQSAQRLARRSGATHPKAQYRLVDLVRTLASHLVEPLGEVKQAFAAVLAEMNALQACLPQFVSGSRLLDDLNSVQLQHELDEVDDALTVARAQFMPFAYRVTSPG